MDLFLCVFAYVTGAGRNHCIQDDDVIDLVNSPYLMMPGTVSLDSDEELDEIRKKADVGVSSPQLDTIAINVKVKYRSTIEEFSFRRVRLLLMFISMKSVSNV